MIIAIDILQNYHVLLGLLFGCKKLIYNKKRCNDSLYTKLIALQNPEIINGFEYRIAGSYKILEWSKKSVNDFNTRYPDFLKINGVDCSRVIARELYWEYYFHGGIWHSLDTIVRDKKKIIKQFPLHRQSIGKYIKWYIKFFVLLIKRQKKLTNEERSHKVDNIDGRKKCILIKDIYEITFLKDLVMQLEKDVFLLCYESIINSVREAFPAIPIVPFKNGNDSSINLRIKFLTSPKYFPVLFSLSRQWVTIQSYITSFKLINWNNVSCILIVEGENMPVLSLVKNIVDKSGTKVINVMNGLKAGEAHDGDVNFHYWGLWDNEMIDFFNKRFKNNQTTYLNLGHLNKDTFISQAIKYDKEISCLKNNGDYIAIFLSRIRSYKQLESLMAISKMLEGLLKDNTQLRIMVKLHPQENTSITAIKNIFKHPNYTLLDNNKICTNDNVDLIMHSKVVITFGSTVVLSCVWLNKLCLNFEINPDESYIYFKDNDFLKKVSSVKQLEDELIKAMSIFNNSPGLYKEEGIVKKYADFINSL